MNNNNKLAVVPTSSQLAVQTSTNLVRSLDDISKIADVLAKSGFFDDAKTAAQCYVKVLAGHELGIKAFQAMTGIHIIKGKPTVGAGLMASRIKSSGKYDYEVLEHTALNCEIAIFEVALKPDILNLKKSLAAQKVSIQDYKTSMELLSIGVSRFSAEDAAKAQTQNMAKFARNMLFARCISNAVKWFCPDVFECLVYTPEELGANTDDDGNLIVEIEQRSAQPVQQNQWSQQISKVADDSNLKKELEHEVINACSRKGWDAVKDPGIQNWIKSVIQGRYKKNTRSEMSIDELRDIIAFIDNYQNQEEYVDADAVEVG
jgi:hypothetical protein